MAKTSPTDADHAQVVAYLGTLQVLPSAASAVCLDLAKSVHRATHSLILWRFRLVALPAHSQVFVEEIASDALQLLPQFTLGFAKPFELLTRGVIENTIRHIYFTDHPIEFYKMNTHPKWYMQTEELFTYATEHPVLGKLEKHFNAIHRLRDLYSELSATVHGRRVQDFQMKNALTKITFDEETAKRGDRLLKSCTESVNALLAAFHAEQFHNFASPERRLVLRTICPKGRRALTQI
jgi:hypothetical protein